MPATPNFNSARHRRLLQFIVLLALMAVALPGGAQLALEEDAQAATPALPVLEFRTYDAGWLRYRNSDEAGELKLAVEDIAKFPFRHVMAETLFELDDLNDAETLAEQLEAIGEIDEDLLAYDEEEIVGICDTMKLSNSTDAICVPGTSAMPDGRVFLALFQPETFALVALTTPIDNIASAAANADWTPTATPPPAPAAQPGPAEGCGPYTPGKWLTAEEYEATGLDLNPRGPGALCVIGAYNCFQPDEGAPYMQAHCKRGQVVSDGGGGGDGVVVGETVETGDGEDDEVDCSVNPHAQGCA